MALIFNIIEKVNDTGNLFAKIVYQNEEILMIDLKTNEYVVFDTEYKDLIDTGKASEGIFYVPGLTTVDMTDLYQTDEYAKTNEIVGIKIVVEDEKISVAYQESPKDLCQYQSPTNSPLTPIVCLPNQLIINVYSNFESMPVDSYLE